MFSEDPTLPVGALLMAAACCFVALRARQEGKYLAWGASALALAGVVLAVEWFWVTDEERIEGVVYDVRRALLASDSQRIMAHLTPDVQYVQGGSSVDSEATRAMIANGLSGAKFDVVRIRELQASAGRRTRRGRAEFKVFSRGSFQGPLGFGGLAGAADSTWSLGFEETKPGVWKINRITPISTPILPSLFAGGAAPRGPATGPFPEMDPSLHGPLAGERGHGRGDMRLTRKSLARERERQRQRQPDRIMPAR